jgi:tetratricopeptide (TPR) repeat protein
MLFHKKFHAAALLILTLAFSARAFAHGDLSERIMEQKRRIAQHPRDGTLQFELANLLFQEEHFSEALTTLNQLDQLAPDKFFTDNLRGSSLLALGRPGEARTALDRFLKVHPGNLQAITLRARALTALNLKKEAVAEYRQALKQSAKPEPDLVQEAATAMVGAGLSGEALTVLDQGSARSPALAIRALELEVSLKRFDAALARVAAFQRTAPRPEPWMARTAEILTAAGRIAESRAAWQALIDHLAGLPSAERGSHAMSRIVEQARTGLHSLQGLARLPGEAPVAASKSSPVRSKQ